MKPRKISAHFLPNPNLLFYKAFSVISPLTLSPEADRHRQTKPAVAACMPCDELASMPALGGCHPQPQPCLANSDSSPIPSNIDCTSSQTTHEQSTLEPVKAASERAGDEADDAKGRGVDGSISVDGGLERGEDDEGLSKRLRVESTGDIPRSIGSRGNRVEAAWEHWKKLREPKFIVAPMVDQSELPFRMLCRKYGASAAYTPMLHARLFSQDPKYRANEFSTCLEDRPLFVQFCANSPNTLLEAARIVEPFCDYVDINLGCPQRIAKRGNYGAFLMDDLPLVSSLVSTLASNLSVPVSCKIRLFPHIDDTIRYARMIEEAGCSLLAVHGRTRDQKDSKAVRADWDAIKAVKNALKIPVLANGNIRWLNDVHACLSETGADGILSAESLLENPALFAGYRPVEPDQMDTDASPECLQTHVCEFKKDQEKASFKGTIDPTTLLLEYLEFCGEYPVPPRMIRAHVHRILGNWFRVHPDLREAFNREYKFTFEWLRNMVHEMHDRINGKTLNSASQNHDDVAIHQNAADGFVAVS